MNEPARIVPAPVAFKHDWKTVPSKWIDGHDAKDGCSRTIRTCAHCGIHKITVHGADGRTAWRRWQLPGRSDEWAVEHTPPCQGPRIAPGDGAEPVRLPENKL